MRRLITKSNLIGIVCLVLLSGCFSTTSHDPEKVYLLWSGEKPPVEVKPINGQYWESPHFTKEYIMYLELKAPRFWVEALIDQNNLKQTDNYEFLAQDPPAWFRPPSNWIAWISAASESVYYTDPSRTHMFIYEIQL